MPSLAGVIIMLRWAGMSQILKILGYTLRRGRLDRQFLQRLKDTQNDSPLTPGRLLKNEPIPSGARFEFENANLEVIFLAPDLARIAWYAACSLCSSQSRLAAGHLKNGGIFRRLALIHTRTSTPGHAIGRTAIPGCKRRHAASRSPTKI